MASKGNMFAQVVIAGSYKALSKATRGAKAELDGLAGKSKATANVMKKAFVGLGLVGVTKSLIDMAKAASEDDQGVRLLAQSMKNNVKGQAALKAGVESTITSLSMMAAVTDDEIRPAFAYLIRSTKSVKTSTGLMKVALDLAAGAHVSVGAAASALGRAFNGNLTALNKLAPGIKKLKDPIGEVAKRFKGMAAIQGQNDPFKLMQITADEAKESIGRVLLPEIKRLAIWLQSKEGQKAVKETTDAIIELVKQATKLAKWAIDNKEIVIAFGIALKTWQISASVIDSWKTIAGIWSKMKKPDVSLTGGKPTVSPNQYPKPIGPKAPMRPGRLVPEGFAGFNAGLSGLATIAALKGASYSDPRNVRRDIANARREYGQFYSPTEFLLATGKKGVSNIAAGGSNMSTAGIVNFNITIPNGDPRAIVTELQKLARRKGVPVSKLLQ